MSVSDIEETEPSVMRTREDTRQLEFRMFDKWIKVSESKMRLRKMLTMRNKGVGFNDIEEYLKGLEGRTVLREGQGYQDNLILAASMNKKIYDEKGNLRKAKLLKESLREEFREINGRDARLTRNRFRYLNRQAKKVGANLETKFDQKISHLIKKHDIETRRIHKSRKRKALEGRYIDTYPDLWIYKGDEENKR